MRASSITIHYESHLESEIDIARILNFVRDVFPVQAESKPYRFEERAAADARVYDLKRPHRVIQAAEPSTTDDYRGNFTRDMSKTVPHVTSQNYLPPTYDGFELQSIATKNLNSKGDHKGALDVILTELLTCTFGGDYRYHARALVGSNPALISVSGIVEAAARPKEYYFERLTCFDQKELVDLDKRYSEAFVVRHDPRMSKIVEGYILQAVMYYETGEAFCTDSKCRLYNAHWQSDLIRTQILDCRLCKMHQDELSRIQSPCRHGA